MNKKKYSGFLIILVLLAFNACSDEEPIPPADNTLQPQSEISLSGYLSEPSGIVYRSKSNSLFVVSDTTKKIYESDLSGNFLREIDVTGHDLEGITFSLNEDTIYVVEESGNKVTSYLLDGTKIGSFTIDVSVNDGSGLEGIAIDNQGYLYVIIEKSPRNLIKLSGETEIFRKEISAVDDLSDICYDKTRDSFWIISDESKKIILLDKEGTLQSEWKIPFNKGEGITIVQDKIFVVNDENSKLYIFSKPE